MDESVEEHYLRGYRKEGRQERKLASAKDRSKWKKTDQNKLKISFNIPELVAQGFCRGRVLAISSQGLVVQIEDEMFACELRGILKKDRTLKKNLVVVGDFVWVEKLNHKEGSIAAVEPRTSCLSRADNLSRRKEQLIAANIDQVFITVSVIDPPLKPPLIDRYIIAAELGGLTPVLVINKIDLLQKALPAEIAHYQEAMKAYKQAKIPIICSSIETGEGIEQIRQAMIDKASVFSGQSGVGKSSLINAVTGLSLRTAATVTKTKKGAHTTTSARLIPLENGGWCVDTPGIKSFGVWSLRREDVEQYFTEIHQIGRKCKFSDCSHSHEEDCAVIRAIKKGKISWLRYESYRTLRHETETEHISR